ncbi:P-loop containing nucleoside triphosphate hydrolase protein [Camillea tinctor]|nr:P-loop containing nucleoside triphosphate hydrolase protein [Camillea tinctor]
MASGVGNNDPAKIADDMGSTNSTLRSATEDPAAISEDLPDNGGSPHTTLTNLCHPSEGDDEPLNEVNHVLQHNTEHNIDSVDDENVSLAPGNLDDGRFDLQQASTYNDNGNSNGDEMDSTSSKAHLEPDEDVPFNQATTNSIITAGVNNDQVTGESLIDSINATIEDEPLFGPNSGDSIPSTDDDTAPPMYQLEHDAEGPFLLDTLDSGDLGYSGSVPGLGSMFTDGMIDEDYDRNSDGHFTQDESMDSDTDTDDNNYALSSTLKGKNAITFKSQASLEKGEQVSAKKKQTPRKKTGPRARTAKEWFARENESRAKSIAEGQGSKRRLDDDETIANTSSKKTQKRQKLSKQSSEAMFNSLQHNNIEARIALGHIPEAEKITAKTKTSQLEQIMNQVPQDASKRAIASDKNKLIKASRSFGYGNCVAKDGKWLVKGMKTALYDHQVIGSSRMLGREFSYDEPNGGILADEMGMGKTLEILTCIVSNPPEETDEGDHKATLIIAPANVIKQWEGEVKKHADRTHIKGVLIFKQSQKLPEKAWENMDIIIASYHEVARQLPSEKALAAFQNEEYDDEEEREERFNELLGPLLRTRFWRVVLDECQNIRNENSKMFLACRDIQSRYRWAVSGTPFFNDIGEAFSYLKFLVPGWNGDLNHFQYLFDYITDASKEARLRAILSQIMIRRTMNEKFMGRPTYSPPMCYEEFKRIELDTEERIIYDVVETRFREILEEQRKKAMSGIDTVKPIHYLGLLLRLRQAIAHPFLLEPTLKHTLRAEDIFEIQDRLAKASEQDHSFNRIQFWCANVTREINNGHTNGLSGSQIAINVGRFGYELHAALASKDHGLCQLCFQNPEFPHLAECDHVFCKECIDDYMLGERQSGRQLLLCPNCEKPLIGLKAIGNTRNDEFEPNSYDLGVLGSHSYISGASQDMTAFYEQFHATVVSNANEPLGRDGKKLGQDFLGVRIKLKRGESSFLLDSDKAYPEPIAPSAKTKATMEAILNWQTNAPDDKIIIFHEFKMTGAIIGRMLQAQGILFLYYNGDMTKKQKNNAIQTFKDQKEVKILIMTLKSGSVGMNLTCANRVILLDLWWNHAIESQAFSRTFRIGQTKETYFLRIVAQNTIDNRIEAIQGTKLSKIGRVMKSRLSLDQAISLLS